MAESKADQFRLRAYGFEPLMMGALALFVVACIALMIAAAPASDTGFIYSVIVFFCVMLLIPLNGLYTSLTWLQVYKEGIWIHDPFHPDRFLPWGAIAQIRSSLWGSSLILADSTGRIKAGVYSSHKNSHFFLGWLMQERPDIWRSTDGLTFTKSSAVAFIFIGMSVLALALGVTPWPPRLELTWPFLACSLVSLGFVVLLPYSISIAGDAMVAEYPFRERLLLADQIKSIRRMHQPPGYVWIEAKKGIGISLPFFSLGVDMLFGFLSSWHTSRTLPRLPAPFGVLTTYQIPPKLRELPKLPRPQSDDE